MTSLKIFLLPGHYVLSLLFGPDLAGIDPAQIAVLSGIVSWVIWAALIRVAWAITLKLFGFSPRGH